MRHYTHLGAGPALGPVAFVATPTKEGDGFVELFQAYAGAFPTDAPERANAQAFARTVCLANGVPFTTAAVESWIFGISGKRRPFNASNNPGMYGGPKNVGWAYFAEGNTIKLPDFPRPGVARGAPDEAGRAAGASAGVDEPWWSSPWVYGGLAVVAAVVLLSGPKKKRESEIPQGAF